MRRAGRGEAAVRPDVEVEGLGCVFLGVAVEDGAGGLGAEAEFVQVGGEGHDAGVGKIEVGDGAA